MLTARTTTGMGVEMDIAKALDLYSQSGKQGHASALIRLGYLYQFGMAEPGTDTHPDSVVCAGGMLVFTGILCIPFVLRHRW